MTISEQESSQPLHVVGVCVKRIGKNVPRKWRSISYKLEPKINVVTHIATAATDNSRISRDHLTVSAWTNQRLSPSTCNTMHNPIMHAAIATPSSV